MAFVRQKKDYLTTVRINFGTLVGEEKEEDAFIVLKEMNTLQTMELNEANEKGKIELMKFFQDNLPCLIVDHNLYETEDKKMTNEDIAKFVFEKMDITSKVIAEYTDSVFQFRGQNKEGK